MNFKCVHRKASNYLYSARMDGSHVLYTQVLHVHASTTRTRKYLMYTVHASSIHVCMYVSTQGAHACVKLLV